MSINDELKFGNDPTVLFPSMLDCVLKMAFRLSVTEIPSASSNRIGGVLLFLNCLMILVVAI